MTDYLKIKEGKLYYYNTPIAFVDDYDKILVADSMFKSKELDSHLQENWNVRWVDGIFTELTDESREKAPPVKSVRVWFLHPDIDTSYKFIPFHKFEKIGGHDLTLDSYVSVFDSTFPSNDLDEIFSQFQLGEVSDFTERKLAIGDVIELYDHLERHFYYIDKVGFKEVSLIQ